MVSKSKTYLVDGRIVLKLILYKKGERVSLHRDQWRIFSENSNEVRVPKHVRDYFTEFLKYSGVWDSSHHSEVLLNK